MKIMIIHAYYFPEIYGGAEYSVKKLAETLRLRGHEVRVLCSGEKDIMEIVDGVEVQRLKLKTLYRAKDVGNAPRWKRLLSHLIGIWNLKNEKIVDAAIKGFEPDVVHTNCLYGFSPIVWKVAKKNGVHVVHTLRDYHLMCPLVALSCSHTNEKNCNNPKWSCKFHRGCNRLHSAYVDSVTAPSKCTLDMLVQDGFFKESYKSVIPNAIDFDVARAETSLDRHKQTLMKRNKTVFVYLGGLTEQKGIRWMIESFQKIPNDILVELIIAGKGVLEKFVETKAKVDSRIHFLGFLDEIQVSNLLDESDVLICPSLWDEPFGRVVLDAYKSGIPVISSNKGALPELVKNRNTGIIVEAGNVTELHLAMMNFIANKNLIVEYGKNAILELNKYSLDYQAAEFEKIYLRKV